MFADMYELRWDTKTRRIASGVPGSLTSHGTRSVLGNSGAGAVWLVFFFNFTTLLKESSHNLLNLKTKERTHSNTVLGLLIFGFLQHDLAYKKLDF